MTLVAVWRAEDRLMAIADTRISRSPGNVLTEHGPKLLPLQIICRQPGPDGDFSRVSYRAEIGFAYAGSTLSALATHALANTLLSKLIGAPGAPPPMLYEVALFVAGAAAEYMRDVCQLADRDGLCSAVVFGKCPQTNALKVFLLTPELQGGVRVTVSEQHLAPIRLAGTGAASAVIIGSAPALLMEEIDRQLADARNRGETHEIVAYELSKASFADAHSREPSRTCRRSNSASLGYRGWLRDRSERGAGHANTAFSAECRSVHSRIRYL